jgi:hypothetical protein
MTFQSRNYEEKSSLISEYKIVVSFFFWLNMPDFVLRKIVRDANFTETPQPKPLRIAPGIELAPGPLMPLASYKSVKVDWNSEKFMLLFEGTVNDVVEALNMIKESFNKHNYSLEKICHYYEITFPSQPLDIDGFVSSLRKKVNLGLTIDGEELKLFSISLSNVEEPISREYFYKWFHISISPDVNAPQKRIAIQIIKRETSFEALLNFLKNIDNIIEELRSFLKK